MNATIEELATASARVAQELAVLHEQGQTHGAVDAEHAILEPLDAVELKANQGANRSGAPHDDVAALGGLLLDALGAGDPFRALRLALTAPEQTGWRRFLPIGTALSPAAALRELALEAATASAEGPTAADLSTRLQRVARGQQSQVHRRLPNRVVRAGGLVTLGAAGLLALSTLRAPGEAGHPPPSPQALPAPPSPVAGVAVASRPPPAPATRLWPSPPPNPGCPTAGPLSADVDGDGCPDTVEVGDGIIRAGPRRWAVGSSNDVIVLGDWNCDRTTTPAVLRPATGGLFVFDRWATAVEPQPARPVGVVPGAVGLEARGCGHAAVRLSDRSIVVVATATR